MNQRELIDLTRRNDWIISSPFSRVSYPSGSTDLAVLTCHSEGDQPLRVEFSLIFHPIASKQRVQIVPRHLVI